jgi:hypothetical protein
MKRSTCLTTIGVGCGLLLLIGILLAVAGWIFTRGAMRGIDATIEARSQIEERHGQPEEFVPWPDGAIPADRMETFLRVRETCAPARRELGAVFDSFPPTEDAVRELEQKSLAEKFGFLFGASRTVMGLPGHLGRFTEARNRALLDAGMGLGEYTYIYVLAYDSWPALSPAGGVEHSADEAEETAPPDGAAWAGERVRQTILTQLRNQLSALPQDPGPEFPSGWRESLAAEIEALEADPLRVPWQDGLPGPVADSLAPYRQRLEATYEPLVKEYELSRVTRQGLTIHGD